MSALILYQTVFSKNPGLIKSSIKRAKPSSMQSKLSSWTSAIYLIIICSVVIKDLKKRVDVYVVQTVDIV